MLNRHSPGRPGKARGAVLVVALIFLLLLALVGVTVMQTSMFETQMAGNDQFKEEAFQRAEAVAAAIPADLPNVANNFTTAGGVGWTVCKTGATAAMCDENKITVDSSVSTVPSGVALDYYVVRQAPEFAKKPHKRRSEDKACGISCTYYYFEVVATYDSGDTRLGNATVVHGIEIEK